MLRSRKVRLAVAAAALGLGSAACAPVSLGGPVGFGVQTGPQPSLLLGSCSSLDPVERLQLSTSSRMSWIRDAARTMRMKAMALASDAGMIDRPVVAPSSCFR